MEILSSVLNIVMAAVGLGFVIFIHELGHFLLAKANGVKVEKFSIGFGPALFKFQFGETVYALAVLPLGGFVKMLGEGEGEEAGKTSDPRSYQNKSVGQRMSIISAGVIMNLIFGMICFVIYYRFGATEIPAKFGAVFSGSPAFVAGLLPGDEVIAIDGKKQSDFNKLKIRVALSGTGQKVRLKVRRPGVSEPIDFAVTPRLSDAQPMPTIGIAPSEDTEMLPEDPYLPPAGVEGWLGGDPSGFHGKDTLIEAGLVGGPLEKIDSSETWLGVLSKYSDRPLEVVVERKIKPEGKKSAGSAAVDDKQEPLAPPKQVRLTIPSALFVDFGFKLQIKPISSMRIGSPAEKAGFEKGDRIVKINGSADFDPLRIPDICFASAGKPVSFEVERARESKNAGDSEVKTLTVTPDATPPWLEPLAAMASSEPLKVPGLGLTYGVEPVVKSVASGSPADRVGIKVGDKIRSLELVAYDLAGVPPHLEKFTFFPMGKDKDKIADDWTTAFLLMQQLPRQSVVLKFVAEKPAVLILPEPDPTWHFPQRGLRFMSRIRKLPPFGVLPAIERGYDDTIDSIGMVYATLRGLIQRRLSPKTMGGPVMIATVGFRAASEGWVTLIHFLGLLSVNLAVLNFLPISPFDGGHFLFLLIEKIIGRPVPDSAQALAQWVGIALVLVLFVLVTYQDIARLIEQMVS